MKKRLLIFTMLTSCLLRTLSAQTDSSEFYAPYDLRFLENMEDTCTFPFVVLSPVIHYNQGPVAYLEFSDEVGSIQLKDTETGSLLSIWVGGTSKLIENLLPDKKYEILTLSRCEVFEPAGAIDTKSGEKETLDVSSGLYDAIREFQQSESAATVPLSQFLATREDVSFFEKVYFVQQYFLRGQAISTLSLTDLPSFVPPTICNCKFVFNISQIAVPGVLNPDGTISPKTAFQTKKPMSGVSYNAAWWNRNTKGAAKWHQLWTEGSKAGGTDHKYEMKMSDSTAIAGTQYGQLRYNLLCTNFEQVPADCMCEKGIYLYWRYDSETCAHAEMHTEGWGSRNAVAAAEDMAIVVLKRDGANTADVLDGGVVRARAECERTVNNSFWTNAFSLAIGAAGVIFGGGAGIFTGIAGLAGKIDTFLNTPHYSTNFCNSDNCKEVSLCFGDTLVYLQPNKPINLYLFSNTSLMAGGRRSWFSWSRVLSDFHLTGYVPGGYSSTEQMGCCTPKYANWVLASELGAPHTTSELKTEVGMILSAWAPWPFPQNPFSGVVQIPYEYYTMSVPVVDCPSGGNLQGMQNRSFSDHTGVETSKAAEQKVLVFDLSGRLLHEGKTFEVPSDYRNYIKTHIPKLIPGVYVIHTLSLSGKKVTKVYID